MQANWPDRGCNYRLLSRRQKQKDRGESRVARIETLLVSFLRSFREIIDSLYYTGKGERGIENLWPELVENGRLFNRERFAVGTRSNCEYGPVNTV